MPGSPDPEHLPGPQAPPTRNTYPDGLSRAGTLTVAAGSLEPLVLLGGDEGGGGDDG
jgi:hypothetical protein